MQHLSNEAAVAAMRSVALPDVVDVAGLAWHLGLSESEVRAHLRAGRLPGRKIGRRWFVVRQELMAFLVQSRSEEVTP